MGRSTAIFPLITVSVCNMPPAMKSVHFKSFPLRNVWEVFFCLCSDAHSVLSRVAKHTNYTTFIVCLRSRKTRGKTAAPSHAKAVIGKHFISNVSLNSPRLNPEGQKGRFLSLASFNFVPSTITKQQYPHFPHVSNPSAFVSCRLAAAAAAATVECNQLFTNVHK